MDAGRWVGWAGVASELRRRPRYDRRYRASSVAAARLGACPRTRSPSSLHSPTATPIDGAVGFAADRLNQVQSWTIRAYLTMVFSSVVLLLMVLAVWH